MEPMDMSDRNWQVRDFLKALYGHYPKDYPGWVELRSLAPNTPMRRVWVPIQDLTNPKRFDRAASDVALWCRDEDEDLCRDVYAGVLPRDENDSGVKSRISLCGIVWADVDFKALSRHDADIIIGRIEPSLVVDTGGGYHVYNRLDAAYPVDEDTLPRIERSVMSYQRKFGPVDHTHDLTRILRVPGTHNHKPDRSLAEVRLALREGCPIIHRSEIAEEEARREEKLALVRACRRAEADERWGELIERARDFPFPVRVLPYGRAGFSAERCIRAYVDQWVSHGVREIPVDPNEKIGLIPEAEGILEDLSDMVFHARGYLLDGIAIPERLLPEDTSRCIPLGGI